jgi:hypothetical protein
MLNSSFSVVVSKSDYRVQIFDLLLELGSNLLHIYYTLFTLKDICYSCIFKLDLLLRYLYHVLYVPEDLLLHCVFYEIKAFANEELKLEVNAFLLL